MRRYLALLLLLAPARAVLADVTFGGKVEFFSPLTSAYEPLINARVRVVLWESSDWDTLDPETTTAADGRWQVSKGNPWFASGYGYQVIVYAEVPGFLEVQNTLPQVNGYQGLMEPGYAPQNRSYTTNIKIGGAQANVLRYACGGDDIIAKDVAERAFFILHEMTDHRRQLLAHTSVPADAWEEKEVVYPYDQRVGSYSSTWDAIYLPAADTFSSYARASEVCRHELTHGLVRDAYTVWLIPWGKGGAHTLYSPCDSAARAWGEAIADYMAQYTYHRRYNKTTWPIGRLDDPSRPQVNPLTQERNWVEGDIASALWHLTHPGLDRPRAMPQLFEPQEQTYRDNLDDPRLDLLWGIISCLSPGAFVDEAPNSDTVVNHWRANNPGEEYAIKRVLFNHGLRSSLTEHEPTVQLLGHTWNGSVCDVRLRLLEADEEDLDNMRLSLLVNKRAVLTERIPRGRWRADPVLDNVAEYTWQYHHVRNAIKETRVDAQLDDGMVSVRASLDLDPPASAQLTGLTCEVLGVALHNPTAAPLTGARLRAGFAGQAKTDLPERGGWTAPAGATARDATVTRLADLSPAPETVALEWQPLGGGPARPAELGGKPAKAPAPTVVTFSALERYGLGEHTVVLPLDERGATMTVVYRIGFPELRLTDTATDHLARVLGPELTVAGPRAPRALSPKPAAGLAGLDMRGLANQAAVVQRRIAQLQRDSLETAQEIEWLLNPEQTKQIGGQPKAFRPGEAVALPSKRPLLVAPLQHRIFLAKPATPFLDQAAAGAVPFEQASDKLKARLEPLARRIMAIEHELARLTAESETVRANLMRARDAVSDAKLPSEVKQAFLDTLPDTLTRLTALSPLGQDHGQLLAKQAETVRRALGGKPAVAIAPVKPVAPAKGWGLEVLGVELTQAYTERFNQDKYTLSPRGEKAALAVVRCRLTNTGAGVQVPILSERLAGSTRLDCAGGEKAQLRDVDALQLNGKLQSYAAAPVEPGASVEFALIFELPAGSQPTRLWFTLQNYPDDVGGEGETRELALR